MNATRAVYCHGKIKILSPSVMMLVAATLLLPRALLAQPSVCPPSCEPFGECVPCVAGVCVGKYCRCDDNHEGDDCSLQVEYCPAASNVPGSQSRCLNGGRCTAKEIMENPDGFGGAQEIWRCDCTIAVGSASDPTQHAGAQCEFPSTQSCFVGGAPSTYAFCVNGGDCVQKIIRGEPHPGCINCRGFEGRHCQYKEGEAPKEELMAARNDIDNDDNGMKPGFIVVFVFLACLLLGSLAMFVMRRRTTKQENKQAAVAHASSSDVPTDLKLEEETAGQEATQPTAHGSDEDDHEEKETKPEVV